MRARRVQCRCVVFPKKGDWRYCRNRPSYVDPIKRGWCWRHMPSNFVKSLWNKTAKQAGLA